MKKKLLRTLALWIFPPLGAILIRLLYRFNKKVFHLDESLGTTPAVFAVWHGNLLLLAYVYYRYRKHIRGRVLISDHFDGLLISKTIRYFGFETIAGSSNRKAAKTLLQAIRSLKQGYDIGITPDGPKGPRHYVHDGVIVMAQKTRSPIVLVSIRPTKYWQLRSWDRFVIPKPFGTIHFYTKIIDVSDETLEDARLRITQGLLEHER